MVQGQVYIGQGLGLDALHRVHHQYGNVAGCRVAADFIVEVHMSWGVCQVRDILLPGFCGIAAVKNDCGICGGMLKYPQEAHGKRE